MRAFRNRAEYEEWVAMNEDNARATNKAVTPSEYTVEQAKTALTDVSTKFGRVWQAS